jgi:hypothetical protein
MKKLLLSFLLLPSLVFAADCPWTLRGAVKSKEDAIKRCGPPDDRYTTDTYQSGSTIVTKEEWVYFNSDGTYTVIRFRGNKQTDFDQKRR